MLDVFHLFNEQFHPRDPQSRASSQKQRVVKWVMCVCVQASSVCHACRYSVCCCCCKRPPLLVMASVKASATASTIERNLSRLSWWLLFGGKEPFALAIKAAAIAKRQSWRHGKPAAAAYGVAMRFQYSVEKLTIRQAKSCASVFSRCNNWDHLKHNFQEMIFCCCIGKRAAIISTLGSHEGLFSASSLSQLLRM